MEGMNGPFCARESWKKGEKNRFFFVLGVKGWEDFGDVSCHDVWEDG